MVEVFIAKDHIVFRDFILMMIPYTSVYQSYSIF